MKICHIVNNTSPTNMGYNDFYLYQNERHSENEHCFCSPSTMTLKGLIGFYFKLKRDFTNVDIFHVHSNQLLILVFLLNILNLRRFSIIYTVHTSFSNLKGKNRLLFFINLLMSDKVVFCSKSSMLSFPNRIRTMRRCSYITNGVNLIERSFSTKGKVNQYIMVGRLIDLKKPEPVIKYFSNRSDLDLLVVGDGYLRDRLKTKYISGNIFYKGVIPRSDVYKELLKSTFFISNSTVEGMPVSVLEAISCGCIPILSDIPPHTEIIDSGLKGIVTGENLSTAIEKASKLSANEREEIVIENNITLYQKFSLDSMHSKYLSIYKSL